MGEGDQLHAGALMASRKNLIFSFQNKMNLIFFKGNTAIDKGDYVCVLKKHVFQTARKLLIRKIFYCYFKT